MEKEKLSAELKGLVGENSLSERTWNDYLEHSVLPFLPSEEEKKEDFLAKHAHALKSINGQLNNEVATKVNDFKKNYSPEPQAQVNEPKEPDTGNKKLEDIESRLKRFEEAEAAKQAAEAKNKLLLEVKTLIKKEGAINETIIGLILPQLAIQSDSKLEDLTKTAKTLYDKTYTDLYGESYVPFSGGGFSGGGKSTDKEAYMKHLKESGRIKE